MGDVTEVILEVHDQGLHDLVDNARLTEIIQNAKDQENPNFSAFDALGSLSNDPIFDPGRLGKRSDGTKIEEFF